MNLPVLSVVVLYGLANRSRLLGLLLESLERVGEAAEEAAVSFGVTSHRECREDEVEWCLRLVK